MKKLYNLDPAEISLVDKGANRKKFLIFKSQQGPEMSKPNPALSIPEQVAAGIEKIVKSFSGKHKVQKEMPKVAAEECAPGEHGGLSDRAQAALKAVGRILHPHKDEIKAEHIGAVAKEIGIGEGAAPEKKPGEKGEVQMEMALPEGMKEEDHMAALGEAKKAYKAHMEKMGKPKYPDAEMAQKAKTEKGDDDVEKTKVTKADGPDLSAFSEEQRAQVEPIFKAHQELVQKNADLEKKLAERDAKESDREVVMKAESYTHVGLPKEDILETLRDAKKVGDASYERVCKNFDALNVQGKAGQSIFSVVGSSQPGKTGGNDAEARINAAVDAIVQKSANGKTREQIYDDFMQTAEGKKLYSEANSDYFKTGGR